MADATLDAGAENCGRLIDLVVNTMTRLVPGQTLAVMAYDPSSQVDLAAWCRMTVATQSGRLFLWPITWNS